MRETTMDIDRVWLSDEAVWVRTADGREASETFDDYPRLRWATAAQRAHYEVDAFGIHWREIDEDLSFDAFFKKKNDSSLYRLFTAHPELNAAAIARRMGMAQSLFAQYISGTKKPSPARLAAILRTIHTLGEEIAAIKFE